MDRKKDAWNDMKGIGIGVGVGAFLTLGALGVVKMVSASSSEKETVAEEVMRVDSEKVRIKVIPAERVFVVYDKDRRPLAEASGCLDVSKRSIDRIRWWSVKNGGGEVTFSVQRRTGDWLKVHTIMSNHHAPHPVRVPFALFAHSFVEVHSFPPDQYTPSPAHPQDPNPCVVCYEHSADTQLLPCAHLTLCWSCLQRLQAPSCPICRRDVHSISFNFKV
eukprot:TRINITY_DN2203_c0_g3_i1.p1 TRINITY_DN2203_c0_g3~~TRINITY_DN2203_c0_g3_i1.p1  ORF type:complete len:237 (+),score=41.14 TRINITY_DN2203_c0_g3_i1:57-713(+)